ncbi:MAG TPA: enolase C-terminal domain-like protein [Myxococcales bacterium]|nr:enolase C-terminal domain-like protein [Myxococcales bacterium]
MPGIGEISVSAYDIPTEKQPESDGTAIWSKTTLVLVEIEAGAWRGLGYTYADADTAQAVRMLAPHLQGLSAFDTRRIYEEACRAVRNHGRGGASAMAISALDVAAWDLKAKMLDLPLAKLLGMVRPEVPAYGSGGFTSYSEGELAEQLGGWADRGFTAVKMKVGREPARDLERVRAARKAVGRRCELFVDANGAYARKQAVRMAQELAGEGVSWFEEPVVKTDLEGLRLVRDQAPMEVSGGEYAYEPIDFLQLLPVLDVMQADATRCGGITGFLDAHALVRAREMPLSSHCAPALHVALGCALPAVRHLEWFFDHQRIERLLFEGAPEPEHGLLRPDLSRPGLGLAFRRKDAERYGAHT